MTRKYTTPEITVTAFHFDEIIMDSGANILIDIVGGSVAQSYTPKTFGSVFSSETFE